MQRPQSASPTPHRPGVERVPPPLARRTTPARWVQDSPLGPITVVVSEAGVQLLALGSADGDREGNSGSRIGGGSVAAAIDAYFAGDLGALDDIPADLAGVTPFRQRVLCALRRVPAGTVMTYGELAAAIGRPGAARAVGGAVGSNPVPLVVPCHRVVAAGGAVGGYSAGLARKVWLLDHEGAGRTVRAGRPAGGQPSALTSTPWRRR